jgi:hypothetical protein
MVQDGPILPIDYHRQSNDGRLTLVISTEATPTRALWTLITTKDVQAAKISLLLREGIPEKHLDSHIGVVNYSDETTSPIKIAIKE